MTAISNAKPVEPSREQWGTVPGATLDQKAIVVAGFLAERGVQTLVVASAVESRTHHARTTDLPVALLTMRADGVLRASINADIIEVRRDASSDELLWRRSSAT